MKRLQHGGSTSPQDFIAPGMSHSAQTVTTRGFRKRASASPSISDSEGANSGPHSRQRGQKGPGVRGRARTFYLLEATGHLRGQVVRRMGSESFRVNLCLPMPHESLGNAAEVELHSLVSLPLLQIAGKGGIDVRGIAQCLEPLSLWRVASERRVRPLRQDAHHFGTPPAGCIRYQEGRSHPCDQFSQETT